MPLVEPFRISNGEVAEKDAIVVAVTSDGLTGYGESSPMSGSFYSSDTPESCLAEMRQRLVPAMQAQSFASLDAACDWIDAQSASPFSKTGLETALWDLEARRRGMPLHRLLGASKDHCESGLAVGLYDDTRDLLRAIARYLPEGYKRVKIKICPGHDVELVRAVRKEFGDIPLMTDANASYTLDDVEIYKQLDDFGLLMFEQPLAGGALEDSAALQRQLKTPICLDESLETLKDLERAAALGSFRIANIKIQRVGGLRNALRIYERARELGLSIWVGTMPELGIGCLHGAALSALDNCDFPTDVEASTRWFRGDIVDPSLLTVREGLIDLSRHAGYAVAYDQRS